MPGQNARGPPEALTPRRRTVMFNVQCNGPEHRGSEPKDLKSPKRERKDSMAQEKTIKVSKKGPDGKLLPQIEATITLPETFEEFQSLGLVKEYPAGVIALANQQLVIKAQASGREHYDKGAEAVQKAVSGYVFGERAPRAARPKLDQSKARELKFTNEQLAVLKSLGMLEDAA